MAFKRRVKFLSLGIQKTWNRKFWKRATLSKASPVGQPGGGCFTGSFERQMEGSGNGASRINLGFFFLIQFMLGAKSGGNHVRIQIWWES